MLLLQIYSSSSPRGILCRYPYLAIISLVINMDKAQSTHYSPYSAAEGALPAPGTVGGDGDLATVVRLRVVHIQLQRPTLNMSWSLLLQ